MLHLFLLKNCPSLGWHKSPRGRRIPLLEIIGQLFHSHEFHTLVLLEVFNESNNCQPANTNLRISKGKHTFHASKAHAVFQKHQDGW